MRGARDHTGRDEPCYSNRPSRHTGQRDGATFVARCVGEYGYRAFVLLVRGGARLTPLILNFIFENESITSDGVNLSDAYVCRFRADVAACDGPNAAGGGAIIADFVDPDRANNHAGRRDPA